MLNIEEPKQWKFPFAHLGFRPFFLLAGVYAVIGMSIWMWLTVSGESLSHQQLLSYQWHAHEMIFGYTLAVAAGFLLTAVRNWTGVQTLNGAALMLLALLWLLARVMPLINHVDAVLWMAVFDLLFNAYLCAAILYPIIKVKQWKQLPIWLAILLLCTANVIFYLGMFNLMARGMQLGLYSGLYIVILLIMLMGRRVIPFFIEKGVDTPVTLVNRNWLDVSTVVLLLLYIVVEVFTGYPDLAQWLALFLFVLHAVRMQGWYTRGIWQKPLLWILYIAYGWIVLGFALKAAGMVFNINPMLVVHALTFGGIGLMTLGMMARVALGHTGRNVFDPPAILSWIFLLAVAGSAARVLLPLLMPVQYSNWIVLSQGLWIGAFALFSVVYAPMLLRTRVDGKYG